MEISIIIRFRNEAKFLEAVLSAVKQQNFYKSSFEIIGVNNSSTDNSLEIFSHFTSHILNVSDYRPGKALNEAIETAEGKYICILSAHTIPANRNWLSLLHSHMQIPKLAGVYGAQLYPVNSKFLDKRDLDIFSTLTPRVEYKDSDFWNANSMFPKEVWFKQPFDENVFELEDHYWTKLLLTKGYIVHFEPEALVYHYNHIKRLDRIFLPPSSLSPIEQLQKATADLLQTDNDWPTVMTAGLTINSFGHLNEIVTTVEALGKQLLFNTDFDVRWRMAQALNKIKNEASVNYLVQALSDPSFYAKDEASWSLARLGDIAVGPIVNKIPELKPADLPFAALALGKSGNSFGEECAVSIFMNEIDSDDPLRQIDAVYFVGEIAGIDGGEKLFYRICKLLESDHPKLRMVCCWALGCFFEAATELHDPVIDTLKDLVDSNRDTLVRFEALVACAKWGIQQRSVEMIDWLKSYLSDPCSRIAYGAAQCLRLAIENGMTTGDSFPPVVTEDFGVSYELDWIGEINKKKAKTI